jgi:DNA mismatch endonuclease (patch repair protein)
MLSRRTRHLSTSFKAPPAISAARSALMASVRQRGTAPELVVRQLARRLKIRFQTNGKHLPGSPDLFMVQPKRAVFVHGCFWHRHPGCKATTTPKSHQEFWLEKFRANLERDRRKIRRLRCLGFRVMTVWECQVKTQENLDRIAHRLVRLFGAG